MKSLKSSRLLGLRFCELLEPEREGYCVPIDWLPQEGAGIVGVLDTLGALM